MKIGSKIKVWNNKLFWIPLLVVLSLYLSYQKPIMLANGGEVTFLSMFFLYLVGYFYGGGWGVLAAVIFAGAKYALDFPDLDNLVAELYDYIIGYGLLGIGGFFVKRKNEKASLLDGAFSKNKDLIYGFTIAAFARFVESSINAVVFYYDSSMSFWENLWTGSIVYSFGYVGVEWLITLGILCVPIVREATCYLKYVATYDYKEDLDSY